MGAFYCRPLGLEEVLKGYCVYLCVRNQHNIIIMQFVLLYTRVYRHAYRTSFRVWFRLCGLLVGEVGPDNCLQSLGIDVAWMASFKMASSDV